MLLCLGFLLLFWLWLLLWLCLFLWLWLLLWLCPLLWLWFALLGFHEAEAGATGALEQELHTSLFPLSQMVHTGKFCALAFLVSFYLPCSLEFFGRIVYFLLLDSFSIAFMMTGHVTNKTAIWWHEMAWGSQ